MICSPHYSFAAHLRLEQAEKVRRAKQARSDQTPARHVWAPGHALGPVRDAMERLPATVVHPPAAEAQRQLGQARRHAEHAAALSVPTFDNRWTPW